MRAGLMRHRGAIQRPADAQETTYGEALPTPWVHLCYAWVAVEPVTGNERYVSQQFLADVTHTVRMRYRDDITITPKCRLVLNVSGRVFEFRQVLDYRERHRELVITAVEEVPARA
jgi:SPP1 family predicted phage head-tail adaptor